MIDRREENLSGAKQNRSEMLTIKIIPLGIQIYGCNNADADTALLHTITHAHPTHRTRTNNSKSMAVFRAFYELSLQPKTHVRKCI